MNKVILIASLFLLAACKTTGTTPVDVNVKAEYPELPLVSYKTNLGMESIEWDYPRNTDAPMVVKNTTACKGVPENERDDDFWASCGEYPITADSNIYVGLDLENHNKLLVNMERAEEEIKLLRDKIDQVNKQRQQWRELNKQNDSNEE